VHVSFLNEEKLILGLENDIESDLECSIDKVLLKMTRNQRIQIYKLTGKDDKIKKSRIEISRMY